MSVDLRADGNIVSTADPLPVTTTTDKRKAGYTALVARMSDGAARVDSPNQPYAKFIKASEDGRLKVGMDTLFFADTFNGTAQNSNNWKATLALFTQSMAGGYWSMIGTVTSGNNGWFQTYRYFPVGRSQGVLVVRAMLLQPLQANNVVEIGLFTCAAGSAVPTDGCYFKINNAGELYGVCNYNGVESQLGPLVAISQGVNHDYMIKYSEQEVEFWVDDVMYGEIKAGSANGQPMMAGSLPINLRMYNTNTVAVAQTLKVSDVNLFLNDWQFMKPWAHQCAGMGLAGNVGQNGHTQGQTVQWGNTAEPTAAAATNTTAALGTGLGGLFKLNAPATSATDVIICSYANVVPTVNITGRNLYITGITVDAVNLGAAVATTGTVLGIACAYGHTNVSLATTEAAAAKAPRRQPLGILNWAVGAAIGAQPAGGALRVKFDAPIVVSPGEFVAIIAKPHLGTATASQVIHFVIGFDSYFE
jgi:hypothetical protein